MADKSDTQDQFEDKLAALEALVKALESGDVRLEEAVTAFEQGMNLARDCEQLLERAELRVQQLSRDADGGERLTPFDDADTSS